MSRRQSIPYGELEPKLRELRLVYGLSMKELSERLGYSVEHLKKLCMRFGIKKHGYNHKIAVDEAHKILGPSGAEGASQHGNHPAATEAKPSDTPEPGSHT